jgi:hypothetical protein
VGAEKIVVKRKPRVVFDTNVVVSALLFASGRLAWLRTAWSKGLVIPLVNRSTVDELLRVLAYPKFKLSSADREELLGDYLPFAELVPPGPRRAETQTCRDRRPPTHSSQGMRTCWFSNTHTTAPSSPLKLFGRLSASIEISDQGGPRRPRRGILPGGRAVIGDQ